MRYYNPNPTSRYCSNAHRTVPPRSYTPPLSGLRSYIETLFTSSGGNMPMLDRADVEAVMRMVSSTRSAFSMMSSASPPEIDSLESGLRDIVARSDARHMADMAEISAEAERARKAAAEMAREDIEVDEKGRMIASEEARSRSPMESVEPRLSIPGEEVTAESITANNKAVLMAELAASRSDSTPPVGPEAVGRRVIPGVPDMPGARERGGLYDTVAAEMKGRTPPPKAPQRVPSVLESPLDLSRYDRTDKVMADASARNFGRK